jgi:hypothetical protein
MTHYINILIGLTVHFYVIGCDHNDSSSIVDTRDAAMMSSQMDATSSPTMDFEQPSSMDANTPTADDDEVIDLGVIDTMLTDAAPMPDMTNIPNYEGPRKKGIAVTHRTYDWSYIVSSLNPFWSYSWGITLSRFQPDGVEFVPMKWSGSMSDEIADRLRSQFARGEISYLLGYNEPDSETQANMTVDRAIALWSELEALGIPLISPSPVHFDNEWTEAFMERAMAEGLRIDFLGFHSYAGTDAQGLLNRLDQLYERYGIPIWITEFAVADWNAETRESNRIRPEDVLTFMRTVLPELDRREHIFRYAWYTDFSSQHLWPSALFDADRDLTPLGEFYAQHTSNPTAGPPKPYPSPPADPGNLLVNGGFERGGSMGWGGYENRVLDIDHVEPHEGAFSGMLRGGLSSAFDQNLTLEAGITYTISLHSRWSEPPGRSVGVVIEETDTMNRTSAQLPEDTDWRETTFTVTPADTKEYVFWVWTGENIAAHLYLDTVSIRVQVPNP